MHRASVRHIWAFVVGTAECIAFASVAVILLSALAQWILRVRLSGARKCLMVATVALVWLGLAASSSMAASQVASDATLLPRISRVKCIRT